MTRKWWTLVTVCLGMLMLLLDITIVNVVLPSIADDLGASFSDLQWTIDAYALSLAAVMLVTGSLGDLLGHRAVFAAGVVIFSVSSLLCGLASDPLFLIISRAVQGLGGAAMFATSLALIAQEFRGRERGTALGIWGATAGALVAVGPLIGGALTSGISWRSVFFVNVPIGALTLGLLLARVAESRRRRVRPDWPGAITFSAALFALVFALIRGNPDGWSSGKVLTAFVAGAVLLVAPVAGRLLERVPLRLLLGGGLTLAAAGLALMTLVEANSGWTVLLSGLILAGSGLTNPPLASAAIGTVEDEKAGVGSGVNNTARQVGIAAGIAALGAIFQSRVQGVLADQLAHATPQLGARRHAIVEHATSADPAQAMQSLPPGLRAPVAHALRVAFVDGFDRILWVAAAIALVGAVLSLVLVRQRDLGAAADEEAPVAGPPRIRPATP